MFAQLTNKNFWIILAADCFLLLFAYYLSYIIRFEGIIPQEQHRFFLTTLPYLLSLKFFLFSIFKLYVGMWRYTCVSDIDRILQATLLSTLIAVGTLTLLNRFEGFSRSVFLLDCVFTFLFVGGLRIGIRMAYQKMADGTISFLPIIRPVKARKKIMIIGAGSAGEKLIRELRDNRSFPYKIAGFLDDDKRKKGLRLHGIKVYGPVETLESWVPLLQIREIIIAIPSASISELRRIVEICQASGLPFKTLPTLQERFGDAVSLRKIREVSYRDLLGRPFVSFDSEKVKEIIVGKRILVTGAGGSIGSELCRQILSYAPEKLILMDSSEEKLYQIQMELINELGGCNTVSVLGKVQDKALLENVFISHMPDVVFHAAAYKHVPLVELNPWEGVFNNVFATKNLIKTAARFGAKRFILISTDKAVRPTNVMGATKRVAEMILQEIAGSGENMGMKCMAVRFGNVLGSSGSVIPLFKRQIEKGGPVTVTHPDVTRFFMAVEEAVALVLQAATFGSGGEIFVLEMGQQVKIAEMARELIRLCGREPDTEIEIVYTGLRPGEKIFEELITSEEGIEKTHHDKIMVLRPKEQPSEISKELEKLKAMATCLDADAIKTCLQTIVPDYIPQKTLTVLSSNLDLKN